MSLETSDLGLVQAIHVGTSPPSETAMIWYNTNPGENKHYYYDVLISSWVLLNQSTGGGTVKEKLAVRVATTGTESLVTYDNGLKTITVNVAEGAVIIDKVSLSLGDRVGWGGDGVEREMNGIYTVTTVGGVSTPWVLTRASDSDSNGEISSGEIFPVTSGEVNQGVFFMLTTDVPVSLGTSMLKYIAFSVFYKRTNPTTVTVGGLTAGSTVSGPIQRTLDRILFPFQVPTFSNFLISGQSNNLELGQKVNGGAGLATFLWSTTNPANIQVNSLSVIDVTSGNITLGSSLANDGTEALAILDISKSTIGAPHQFKVQGIDLQSTTFNRVYNLTWLVRRCFFISATDYYTPSGNDATISSALNALTVTTQYELAATRQMTKSLSPTAHYIYFVWDDSLGGDQNIFTVNGLPNTSWVYKTFSYTNSYGIVRNFRLFRSLNILSTNFNVVVS